MKQRGSDHIFLVFAGNIVLVEVVLQSGTKRLFGVESKAVAEEWKKRLGKVSGEKRILNLTNMFDFRKEKIVA